VETTGVIRRLRKETFTKLGTRLRGTSVSGKEEEVEHNGRSPRQHQSGEGALHLKAQSVKSDRREGALSSRGGQYLQPEEKSSALRELTALK